MRRLLPLLACLCLPWFAVPVARADDPVEIKRIIIATDLLMIKETQIIEIQVRNNTEKDIPLIAKLVITLPNRNIITTGDKLFVAKAQTDTPVIISYPIDAKGFGDYTMSARIYDRQDRPLYSADKSISQYFYALDPSLRKVPPKRRRGPMSKEEQVQEQKEKLQKQLSEQPVSFDPPDLRWMKVDMVNTSVLRGETTHVRLYLINDGGDTAKAVKLNLQWYFTQRPRRKIRFINETIDRIAPGEMKIIELPVTIPDREQPGNYTVLATVDEENQITETDETNNERNSDQELIFGDIALEFPEHNHSFAEDGLFKFAWRSLKYNQFKVQISADATFTDEGEYFEMPKDDKWTPSFELLPMKGEMPSLAMSLMDENETDHLFWRIVAKDEKGKLSESQARRFYINLKAKE